MIEINTQHFLWTVAAISIGALLIGGAAKFYPALAGEGQAKITDILNGTNKSQNAASGYDPSIVDTNPVTPPKNQTDINTRARDLYAEWKTGYLVNLNSDQIYVTNTASTGSKTTVSEAQGYGMYLAALANSKLGEDTQADFDKEEAYYLAHRVAGTQLMSWSQERSGSDMADTSGSSGNSAVDGDIYIAYALIKAGDNWSNKRDAYYAQAQALLKDILTHEYNTKLGILTSGNWADTASSPYYDYMRSSDVMPYFFHKFASFTGNNTWNTASDHMLTALKSASDQSQSGLVPDFMFVNSDLSAKLFTGQQTETIYDGAYYSNAARVPENLSLTQDADAQAVLNKMMTFFKTQYAGHGITDGYQLDGTPLNPSGSVSTAFAAPIYQAAELNSNKYSEISDYYDSWFGPHESARAGFNTVWDYYYDDTLYVLAYLNLASN